MYLSFGAIFELIDVHSAADDFDDLHMKIVEFCLNYPTKMKINTYENFLTLIFDWEENGKKRNVDQFMVLLRPSKRKFP